MLGIGREDTIDQKIAQLQRDIADAESMTASYGAVAPGTRIRQPKQIGSSLDSNSFRG